MSGMMSPQMTDLAGKSGTDFDTAWLTMMIEHHTGAHRDGPDRATDGTNPDAHAIGHRHGRAQQAEITTMKALLQQN